MSGDGEELLTLEKRDPAAASDNASARRRFLDFSSYTDAQKRAVHRVLDSLDKADNRQEKLYQSHRKHARHWYRAVVTVYVLDLDGVLVDLNTANAFRVWARSISQGGLSFVYPHKIDEKTIAVGITMPDEGKNWFFGEVVRVREIPEENFWEYGVAFRGRVGGRNPAS